MDKEALVYVTSLIWKHLTAVGTGTLIQWEGAIRGVGGRGSLSVLAEALSSGFT